MGRNLFYLSSFFCLLAFSGCYASSAPPEDAVTEAQDPPAHDPVYDPLHDPVPDPDLAPDPQPECPGGCGSLQCCYNICVDTRTDMSHCGFCGNVCDPVMSNGCTEGQCSCMGALACRADQKCCVGVGCRNIKTDPSNCGDCGRACAIGETCVDGSCRCGDAPACGPGESCCGGACIDTLSDPLNCGVCNIQCGESGPECVEGECSCGGQPACPWTGGMFECMSEDHTTFQMCCDGICITTSEANCGGCGVVCQDGTACTGVFMFQCRFNCQ
jgi:hypothetical protein